jgi:hypothetical protein
MVYRPRPQVLCRERVRRQPQREEPVPFSRCGGVRIVITGIWRFQPDYCTYKDSSSLLSQNDETR